MVLQNYYCVYVCIWTDFEHFRIADVKDLKKHFEYNMEQTIIVRYKKMMLCILLKICVAGRTLSLVNIDFILGYRALFVIRNCIYFYYFYVPNA